MNQFVKIVGLALLFLRFVHISCVSKNKSIFLLLIRFIQALPIETLTEGNQNIKKTKFFDLRDKNYGSFYFSFDDNEEVFEFDINVRGNLLGQSLETEKLL